MVSFILASPVLFKQVVIGCEDVDDALSCVKLKNGNFSVGVHIADVTNFVKAGSPLDREAQYVDNNVDHVGSGASSYEPQ